MAYFLLRKDPDGSLHLFSGYSWPSRRDALDELSALTADPSFALWDSEVYVVDIDAAAPVLLVRPAVAQPTSQPEVEPLLATEFEPDLATEVEPDLEPVVSAEQPETVEPEQESESESALDFEIAVADPEGAQPDTFAAAPEADRDIDEALDELLVAPIESDMAEDTPVPEEAPLPEDAVVVETEPVEAVTALEQQQEVPSEDEGTLEDEASQANTAQPAWPWEAAAPEEDVPSDAVPEVQEGGPIEEISDFILDVQDIEPAEPSAEPTGYRATTSGVANMTCQECVYVDTCPNSGQRDPATCGSFQWK